MPCTTMASAKCKDKTVAARMKGYGYAYPEQSSPVQGRPSGMLTRCDHGCQLLAELQKRVVSAGSEVYSRIVNLGVL